MNRIHILALLAWLGNVKLAHWQADTRTSDHRTLGDLYDAFDPLLDELAEVDMGKTGDGEFPAGQSVVFSDHTPLAELLAAGLGETEAIRGEIARGMARDYADIFKILDDMQALINRTKFLLKV